MPTWARMHDKDRTYRNTNIPDTHAYTDIPHHKNTMSLYGVEIYLFFLLFLSLIESSLLCLIRTNIVSACMNQP
jgi:hypothetical protein